jgi:hypothetical protein
MALRWFIQVLFPFFGIRGPSAPAADGLSTLGDFALRDRAEIVSGTLPEK